MHVLELVKNGTEAAGNSRGVRNPASTAYVDDPVPTNAYNVPNLWDNHNWTSVRTGDAEVLDRSTRQRVVAGNQLRRLSGLGHGVECVGVILIYKKAFRQLKISIF